MRSSYKFINQKINEPLGKFINKEMFSSSLNKNWSNENLNKFLDDIRKIDQKYHQGLIRTFYWYSEAIKEVGINHQLFFIKMVSAVEALLTFENFSEDDLHKKIKNLINNNIFFKNEKDEIIKINLKKLNELCERGVTRFKKTLKDKDVENSLGREIKRLFRSIDNNKCLPGMDSQILASIQLSGISVSGSNYVNKKSKIKEMLN